MFIAVPILFIILIIKVVSRREKMWNERNLYLKDIENKRLEAEWQQYNHLGRNFSPDLMEPIIKKW